VERNREYGGDFCVFSLRCPVLWKMLALAAPVAIDSVLLTVLAFVASQR
jgi:hypothetical protein